MNKSVHSVCGMCWIELYEDSGNTLPWPARLKNHEEYNCCRCGAKNKSGIFIHRPAEKMKCKGKGEYHTSSEKD